MKKLNCTVFRQLRRLREELGQDKIEYVLLVFLVALALTAGLKNFANRINASFTNVGTKVGTYGGGSTGGNSSGGNSSGGNSSGGGG